MSRSLQAPISLPNSEVERLYDFPRVIDSTWCRRIFVASLDGAATVDGDSEVLSSGADRNLLAIVRNLPDAVLVGVTTAVVGPGTNACAPTPIVDIATDSADNPAWPW